ncbi:unnamed protein product [Rotaria sp. Silwood2]|nr:unnamed protein product [Rotaria sp. Silwood2]CAF3443629.1 unnamed protein product [Rotaria sp. Silwood2]
MEDYLIEVNGQNIENLNHDQVVQCIRAVKHPEPLKLLVADAHTYEYYKGQKKIIHRGLPNIKVMPANRPTC